MKNNIIPKKSLGQNFMINPHILDKIISAAEISKDDIILEVGPGTGNLTRKLLEKSGKVIAVEKDHRLIDSLKETFKDYPNLEITEEDILKFNPANHELTSGTYKLVANIPYYITSNLFRTIFESEEWRIAQPKIIILTIQKEVAQRIMAKPPRMNLLALSVQYYAEPKVIGYISRNNFRPIPKVDSAIIKLTPKPPTPNLDKDKRLLKLIGAGFSEKRKQLINNLSGKLDLPKEKVLAALQKTELKDTIRAENLSLEQWQKLNDYLFG